MGATASPAHVSRGPMAPLACACGPSTDKHQNGGIDEPRGSQGFASLPREGRISPVADDFLLRPQTSRQRPRSHQRGIMAYSRAVDRRRPPLFPRWGLSRAAGAAASKRHEARVPGQHNAPATSRIEPDSRRALQNSEENLVGNSILFRSVSRHRSHALF